MNLTFLKYNNYYNRIVKYKDHITGYLADSQNYTFNNFNFNPGDGVDTEIVINWNQPWSPDYLVCYKEDGTESIIDSRWFILESLRIKGGQYRITLKRDVIVDYYEKLVDAPMFIEKATIQSDSDVAIYNEEALDLNQIKTDEILLKDKTKIPWLVGYFAKNATLEGEQNIPTTEIDAIYANTLESWEFYKYISEDYKIVKDFNLSLEMELRPQFFVNGEGIVDTNGNADVAFANGSIEGYPGYMYDVPSGKSERKRIMKQVASYLSDQKSVLKQKWAEFFDYKYTDNLSRLDGKYIFINSGVNAGYNKIRVNYKGEKTDKGKYDRGSDQESYLNELIERKFSKFRYISKEDPEYSMYIYPNTSKNIIYEAYTIELQPITVSAYTYTWAPNPKLLSDAPYGMFCIPGDSIYLEKAGITTLDKQQALNCMSKIAQSLDAFCYDIQMLPYCPVLNYINGYNHLDETELIEGADYFYIKKDAAVKDIVIFCPTSTFTFDIYQQTILKRPRDTVVFENKTATATNVPGTVSVAEFMQDPALDPVKSVTITIPNLKIEDGATDIVVNYVGFSGAPELGEITGAILRSNKTLVIYGKPSSDTVALGSRNSNFTFDYSYSITKTDYVNSLVVDKKIANQCDLYRLCSPNYSSAFDFNIVKTGNIIKYNVDCTYKPYNPYIHINPVWSNLYGRDFNDVRGLICQGDFSIPLVNEQWRNYQINNKNYLNAFNRQIDSIELQNKYQKIQDQFKAVAGTVQGAANGMRTGGTLGGGAGAVIGGAIGGAVSGIAGIADVKINDILRKDALDLTIDQFNYGLQNIQATPNTLAKVSTYDANNKIFPVLEYYTCTDQEKEIFKEKLKYNGMTVMRIDRMNNFITGNKDYIKGQIIRFDDIGDDAHIITVLADEMNKGVYI